MTPRLLAQQVDLGSQLVRADSRRDGTAWKQND